MFQTGFARCPSDGTPLQSSSEDPLVGEVIAERYLIESVLGSGNFGRVYRARHTKLSRRFAVKVLFGDHASDPKTCERFEREAEAASRLDHPNLVSVVDFGKTESGLLYLVMDFVEGRNLAQLIYQDFPLAPERIRLIATQLAQGLSYAHEQGLVHRDLKPENVIVSETEHGTRLRIVDFGIARILDDEDHSSLTQEGTIIGTPAYMAPEQARLEPIDQRTDLFAMGIIVYEMLAGKIPFDGEPRELVVLNATATPPPVSERVPGLSANSTLEKLAFQLMAKSPAARPQTAREVARRLQYGEDSAFRPDAQTENTSAERLGRLPDDPLVPKVEESGAEAAGKGRRPSEVESMAAETELVSAAKSRSRAPLIAAAALAVIAAAAVVVTRSKKPPAEATDTSAPESTTELESAPGALGSDSGVAAAPQPEAEQKTSNHPATDDATADETQSQPENKLPAKSSPDDETVKAPADPAPVRAKTPSKETLNNLYGEVGRLLRDNRPELGEASVSLEKRYGDIPILDASRNESLRRDAIRELKKLRSEIEKLRASQ